MDVTFFVVILFLFFSLIVSIYLRDILNPLIVLISPIAIQYFLYYIYIQPNYVISNNTNNLLVLTLGFFTFGFLWIYSIPKIKSKIHDEIIIQRSNRDFIMLKKPFLIIGIIGFGIGIITALGFGLNGPGDFFFNLRYSNTITKENTGGIGDYLLLFLRVATLSMIVFRRFWKVNTKTILILITFLLISAAFTMARTELLMTFASVLGAYILSNRYLYQVKTKKSVIITTIVSFFSLAYIFAIGTKKTSTDSNIFFDYIAYPITAFDKWVVNYPYEANGTFTFAFYYKILSLLGLVDYNTVTIGEYVGIPKDGYKTYTLMSAPYLDFKIGGIIIIFISMGMIFGFIYKRVRLGRPYWIIFYSIMLYPLIMGFFEYQFNLSTYVYILIVLIIVYLRSNLFQELKMKPD